MVEATQTQIKYITVERAAELLNKSPHSVRQLMQRGAVTRHQNGFKVLLEIDSVFSYYSRKKGIPSWEENAAKIQHKAFVALQIAASSLSIQSDYLVKLIKNGSIEGYITVAGDIMVARDSINAYLRTPDNDSSDI